MLKDLNVMMNKNSRIYVAGHRGLVGTAILRRLMKAGYDNLILRTHDELDLTRQVSVETFFEKQRPEFVFMAAAKVGGIFANASYPAEFIYKNIQIETNIIHASHLYGVKKLLFLGSSCIYPKHCPQPMKEEHLLSGYLEPSNEPYAVAKIAGIKMCQAYNRQYGTCFISLMPTNLYGPGDNFDLKTSHVLPALIRKFYEAKTAGRSSVEIWGTGTPRREFLHVDDLADACLFLMDCYDASEIINVGVGKDLSILELAQMIAGVVQFKGDLGFNSDKPDGTPVKMLDISRLNEMGWQPKISLEKGVREVFQAYASSQHTP
jgi:GDP-L-fucose synthase